MEKTERILIVDDEKTIRLVISDTLQSHGYQTQTASNPAEALEAFAKTPFDLTLIDIKMPGAMDGIDLLSEIHNRWSQTIVIMMTGYGTLDSAIAALREGAYDYLTKPISMPRIVESVERGLAKRREDVHQRQLITHIEESLRELKRTSTPPTAPEPTDPNRFIQTRRVTIDRQKRLAVMNGAPLELTVTEFDLLDYVVRHADRVVTASELVKAIQGYDLVEADARPIIRTHIRRLRRKLNDDSDNPRIVLNVRGKGYRFAG